MTVITVSLKFNDESQRNEHIKITAEMVQELQSQLPCHMGVFKLQQICIAVRKYNSPESPHE